MKIRIVGGPGRGKTTLATILEKKCNLFHLELDEIRYYHSPDTYENPLTSEERIPILKKLLKGKKSWVIEGVSKGEWCRETFTKADVVIVFEVPQRVARWRLLKRFLQRKIKGHKRKETLKGLRGLFQWENKYTKVEHPDILAVLQELNIPYQTISSVQEGVDLVQQIFKHAKSK